MQTRDYGFSVELSRGSVEAYEKPVEFYGSFVEHYGSSSELCGKLTFVELYGSFVEHYWKGKILQNPLERGRFMAGDFLPHQDGVFWSGRGGFNAYETSFEAAQNPNRGKVDVLNKNEAKEALT
jgi:hypothetical protein